VSTFESRFSAGVVSENFVNLGRTELFRRWRLRFP
jgi:hypothetical protein